MPESKNRCFDIIRCYLRVCNKTEVAKVFNVSHTTVGRIVGGKGPYADILREWECEHGPIKVKTINKKATAERKEKIRQALLKKGSELSEQKKKTWTLEKKEEQSKLMREIYAKKKSND